MLSKRERVRSKRNINVFSNTKSYSKNNRLSSSLVILPWIPFFNLFCIIIKFGTFSIKVEPVSTILVKPTIFNGHVTISFTHAVIIEWFVKLLFASGGHSVVQVAIYLKVIPAIVFSNESSNCVRTRLVINFLKSKFKEFL